ncbi:MAG: hypothetical protein ABID64_04665 [Nitrospirota bacterium]
MKKRVSILVAILVVALAVLVGLLFFWGNGLNLNVLGANVLGAGETVGEVDVDEVVDDYEISLKKIAYDSSQDDTLRFRVKFPEDKESVITFSITNGDGDVVNSSKYSNIRIRAGETSPSDIVLPIEWSQPGTYYVAMSIVDRVSGAVVYEDSANLIYK